MMKLAPTCFVPILLFSAVAAVDAAEFHVAPDGNDADHHLAVG
jgi:hypothetical protein